MKNKAIILDRDGTLNEDPGYVHKVEDFKLLPGVIEGLKLLKDDYIFFIVSNQSGIGRGYYEEKDFWNFTNHLISELEENGIHIEKTFFCPHHPDVDCDCRKPNTQFIDEILFEYDLLIEKSWMVGDHPSDVEFGLNAGMNTILLLTGHGEKHQHRLEEKNIEPNFVVSDFLSAAKKIKNST
jgi:D-glycero-D-manno-heptose 1,7-bisphosphate phosphatase